MKIIKLTVLLFFLSFFNNGILSAATFLVIKMKDSSKVTFALERKPVITFSDNSLIINDQELYAEYPLEDIASYHFEEGSTGVQELEIEKKELRYTYKEKSLYIENIDNNKQLRIYNVSGKIISTRSVETDNCIRIDFSSFEKGIYIVSIEGGISIKIIK